MYRPRKTSIPEKGRATSHRTPAILALLTIVTIVLVLIGWQVGWFGEADDGEPTSAARTGPGDHSVPPDSAGGEDLIFGD